MQTNKEGTCLKPIQRKNIDLKKLSCYLAFKRQEKKWLFIICKNSYIDVLKIKAKQFTYILYAGKLMA